MSVYTGPLAFGCHFARHLFNARFGAGRHGTRRVDQADTFRHRESHPEWAPDDALSDGGTLLWRYPRSAHTVDSLLIVYYYFHTHALETLDITVPSNVTFAAPPTALEDLLAFARIERCALRPFH